MGGSARADWPVAVIGAGLGGLAAAIKLKEAGFTDIAIFEKADSVGGTWRDNSYPGCACDVPVALYQFSFAPSAEWDYTFPRSHEVHRYAKSLVDQFGLSSHLRLGAEATSAVWDEAERIWTVRVSNGETFRAAAIVPALGQLNRPQIASIAGQERFKGPAFHSARWRHDLDLTGKRVGVIGSAASAVQLIPEVAKIAGSLVVFQRTPNWVIPRQDRRITDAEKALLMTNLEMAMSLGARQRQLIFDNADTYFWQAFQYTSAGREAYKAVALDHLHAQVADPVLRAKLTPDYPPGCKRILICDDFYPALQRPNVTLETARIAAIDETGVVLDGGARHDLDVIVYATGFETTGWHWSLDVRGTGGRSLAADWADGPKAYLGLTSPSYPNMFMLYGPHTNLGHNSITFMLERQIEYLVASLSSLRAQGQAAMDVKPEALARFFAGLQERLAGSTWADPNCTSWYKNDKGEITQNWGDNCAAYAEAVREVVWEDYAVT